MSRLRPPAANRSVAAIPVEISHESGPGIFRAFTL